jgi:hypothetical protein
MSALSYLGSSVVPIRSVWPSSKTVASLTSLAGSKVQVAHLDESGISWYLDGGSAWNHLDQISASAN